MVGERRTDLKGPTSTLEIGKYDKLIFSIMLWEYPFCLLESNDGGERNLYATLYDEYKQMIGQDGWEIIKHHDTLIDAHGVNMGGPSKAG